MSLLDGIIHTITCRVLNRFGIPENLAGAKEVTVEFPYGDADTLTKSMERGHVKIIEGRHGELEVNLTDFEVQGLPISEKNTFYVKIRLSDKIKTYAFTEMFHVKHDGERKVIV